MPGRKKHPGRKPTLSADQRRKNDNACRNKWKKANMTAYTFRLYNESDAEIIEYLNASDNKLGLIREALLEHKANHQDD